MTCYLGLLISDIQVHRDVGYSAVIWLELHIGDMFCMPFAMGH